MLSAQSWLELAETAPALQEAQKALDKLPDMLAEFKGFKQDGVFPPDIVLSCGPVIISGKKTGDSLPQSIVTKPDAKQQEMLARNGFSYRRRLALPPGRYGIRFLVRDNVTGKIGTVSTLVNVSGGS